MREKIIAALKSAFTEVNGKASASRILGGAVVVSTILWVTYLVLKTNDLPDLTSAALFVGSGFSGYGINKLNDALKSVRDDEKDTQK